MTALTSREVASGKVVYGLGGRVAVVDGDGHRVILRVNLSEPSRMEHHDDRHDEYRSWAAP